MSVKIKNAYFTELTGNVCEKKISQRNMCLIDGV